MSGEEIVSYVDGIVHEETQITERGLDLTIGAIHVVAKPGRVDFGGGELEAADTAPLETEKRDPDDDYGWWDLDAGQYLVEFNERLRADDSLVVQTRAEVRERGAFHPTLFVAELEAVPLSVPTGGIRLKENARLSTVLSPD